jgi:hypothetical protein
VRQLGEELSGPWAGWSVQDGIRISESIHLVIRAGHLSGVGSDKDGDFEVQGGYNVRSNRVQLTRVYTYTVEPSQEGVGIQYDYEGTWDGEMVAGMWHPRAHPSYGGPFEMWPKKEEQTLETLRMENTAEAANPG